MNYHTKCPNCNSTYLLVLEKYKSNHLTKCNNCSFVFCKPIPTVDELNSYYAEYSYGGDYFVSPITIKRYKEILKGFEKYNKSNRILDVGCGNGLFLSVAKELGWECYGTEYSPKAVELCRNKGLTVFQGSLADVINEIPVVDIVVSFEVIEHVSFPGIEIENISRALRVGGALYITTPNFNSISRLLLKDKHSEITYPEHLCYFTASTLTRLLKSKGFKKKRVETTGISISRIQSAISTKKESPFQQNSTDEKLREGMETKWWLGAIKWVVNSILNITRKGNSLKGLFERIG